MVWEQLCVTSVANAYGMYLDLPKFHRIVKDSYTVIRGDWITVWAGN